MDLAFDSLEIVDFKSFIGKAHIFDFSAHDYGLSMLRGENRVQPALGSNGSGKSTVWDAFCWCLTGKTAKGLRNPDVKPWHGKGKTQVTLNVTIDGVPRTISRTASPNTVLIDSEPTSQEFVERLIGMNYEVLTRTIVLAQNQDLFFDLKPSDKMELFTSALGLSRWDDRALAASEKVKQLETAKRDYLDEEVSLNSKLDQIGETYDDLLEKSRTYEDEKADKLDRLDKEMTAHLKSLDEMKLKKGNAEVEEDQHLLVARELQDEFKSSYDILFEIRDRLTKAEATRAAKYKEIKKLQRSLENLGEADDCPVCGQSLEGTDLLKHKRKAEKEIEEVEASIKKLKIKKLKAEYEKQEARVEQIRPDLDKHEKAAKDARAKADLQKENIADLRLKMRTNDAEVKRLAEEGNPYKDQLSKLKKQRAVYKTTLSETKQELKRLDRRITRTKYWVKGFKDVRLYILTEVLTELEIATNSMLESVGLVDWSVEFEIEVETKSGTTKRGLQVLIHSPLHNEAVRWESWSGGEQQRLRVIGALALSQVLLSHAGVSPDLEIIDEPNRGLSPEGVSDLCNFLRDRGRDMQRQIWYTDQQSVESSMFSSVVTVIHDEGGSRIDG